MKKKKQEKTVENCLPTGIINFDKMTGLNVVAREELIKWLEKEIEDYKKTQSEFVKKNIITEVALAMVDLVKKEGMSLEKSTGKLFRDFNNSKKKK